MGKLLTVNEAIEILRVRHSALYEYIYSGKLKAQRLGGDGGKHRFSRKPYRIWEADLIEFINSGKFTLPAKKKKAGADKPEGNDISSQ